ncbi:MAG: hypothetical protein N2510_03970 [Ignavibacteria bacterium]|nr:hypothetical protein [Ignavibacteria bacterium]
MKSFLKIFLKITFSVFLFLLSILLFRSSLDLYNIFAYENVYLKPSPYGYVPLLKDPSDYSSVITDVKGGSFLYVEDWTRAINGRVVFAKVKSGLYEGFVNQEMLVKSRINLYPIFSCFLLSIIVTGSLLKISNYLKKKIVFSKNKNYLKEVYPGPAGKSC